METKALVSRFWYFLILVVLIGGRQVAFAQPESSFFVIHCDPMNADQLHFNALIQMVDSATAYNVPLTLEFSPQWVDMILADSTKLAKVRSWQASGHEVGAHHHGIYHCHWDSLTNYPPDSIAAHQPQSPGCDSGIFKSVMLPFWNKLDTLAGDSLLLTWGAKDEHPAVDMYPNVPFRTVGGVVANDAFSNPYTAVYQTTIGSTTYGPYTTCEISYCYIYNPLSVNQVIALYNDTTFSNDYSVVGVVTHTYEFIDNPTFFYQWLQFISGKGCKTVREILRPVCSQLTNTDVQNEPHLLPYRFYSNPSEGMIRLQIMDNGEKEYQLHFFNSLGQLVETVRMMGNEATIDISNLAPGIYFYRLEACTKKEVIGYGKFIMY